MSTFYTTFLSKSDFSFALFLVTFEPLEIQQSNISLLKAPKCGIKAVGAQGCRSMSTFCHTPRKIALLLHKMAIICNQMSLAVPLLKAPKYGINAVGAQRCSCLFTFCHTPLKIALLLHKMANECKQPLVAVYLNHYIMAYSFRQ